MLDALTYKGVIKWQYKKLLYLMEKNTVLWGRESIISINAQQMLAEGVLKDFTLRCGNIIAERKFQKALLFTIKTATCIITNTAIWSVYQGQNILKGISKALKKDVTLQNGKNFSQKTENLQKSGIKAKKGENGIGNIPKMQWKEREKLWCALTVEEHSQSASLQVKLINTEKEYVTGATTNTTSEKNEQDKKPVYNITTKAGCFYANGILVSNCDTLIDAVKFCYNRTPSILDVL